MNKHRNRALNNKCTLYIYFAYAYRTAPMFIDREKKPFPISHPNEIQRNITAAAAGQTKKFQSILCNT